MKNPSKNQPHRVEGRGAQKNPPNKFLDRHYAKEHWEGIDEWSPPCEETQFIRETPKNIVNKVESPDVGMTYSLNPYQGCEHGCIYCYARNSHEYWGYNAGGDFESKIIVKPEAPKLLRETFEDESWEPAPIGLSGNTDCYQPIEREMEITREILKVCLEYRHPVGIITKNGLIKRDLDILQELAAHNLVHVMITITTLDRELRRKMEPRTAASKLRLNVIQTLSEHNIPVGVMNAPIIPGLNSPEIPKIIKKAAQNGAQRAGYTIVRLNGSVGELFTDWLHKTFPERAEKVLHQIKECHGGTLNDSRWGTRIRGEGNMAQSIRQLFDIAVKRHLPEDTFELNCSSFRRPRDQQLSMFEGDRT